MDIELLRDYCLSLKGTTEDIKWGEHLCFMVENKIFLLYCLEPPHNINLKIDPEDFDNAVARPGIKQAFHMAKRHWISVENFDVLTEKELKEFILNSRLLVLSKLSKKIQAAYL